LVKPEHLAGHVAVACAGPQVALKSVMNFGEARPRLIRSAFYSGVLAKMISWGMVLTNIFGEDDDQLIWVYGS